MHYVRAIEQLFVLLRRQGFVLSPSDAEIASSWARRGVPLAVACGALIDAADRYREVRGASVALPQSLRYFSAAVLEAAESHRRRALGASADAAARSRAAELRAVELVDRCLSALVEAGCAEERPFALEAYRAAFRELRALRAKAGRMGEGAVTRELYAIDARMVERAKSGAGAAVVEAAGEAAARRLERDGLTPCYNAKLARWNYLYNDELRKALRLIRIGDGEVL